MSSRRSALDAHVEYCPACERDTEHRVAISLLAARRANPGSREPHRVAVCRDCGAETSTRVSQL
ncbi:hypothetical protein MBEHAL_0426 [Halarchaeum acidiphilum MH1-52-1]|uniref:DUF7835 domain-containing protein n=1 Tax=Halarchaeum acidiphilum MH1-52-1 TaxID=1261545 RepID=U2YDC1_9EURY|nr:hypothetical protein [Halarchaeum acidiphilum]GAD51666.1 hypothetical protein MBEHAL_0426 [Halarchaeum acidiphilum MH1-52-1]